MGGHDTQQYTDRSDNAFSDQSRSSQCDAGAFVHSGSLAFESTKSSSPMAELSPGQASPPQYPKKVQQMRFRTQAVHISPTVSAKRASMAMLDLELIASPALRARAAPRTLCPWQTVPVIQASTGVRVMVSNALPVQQTPFHVSPVRVSFRTARAMPDFSGHPRNIAIQHVGHVRSTPTI